MLQIFLPAALAVVSISPSDYLQYGALGLLALFMTGLYLLIDKVVSRMLKSYDVLAQTLVAMKKEMDEAEAGRKREMTIIVNRAKDHVIAEIRAARQAQQPQVQPQPQTAPAASLVPAGSSNG